LIGIETISISLGFYDDSKVVLIKVPVNDTSARADLLPNLKAKHESDGPSFCGSIAKQLRKEPFKAKTVVIVKPMQK
jgi:hypothetical protein